MPDKDIILTGKQVANPPPLVPPVPIPNPTVPPSWDDFSRQAALLFDLLATRGKPAYDSFALWLATERAKAQEGAALAPERTESDVLRDFRG